MGLTKKYVLVPYEITLLSNQCYSREDSRHVLVPYEITLLSNTLHNEALRFRSFSTL